MQDITKNHLKNWHIFSMFRKLIKSLEETSLSLRNFPKPPAPLNNNVLNESEYNNLLKLRFANINQHEVKITEFQRAQLLIEKEKNFGILFFLGGIFWVSVLFLIILFFGAITCNNDELTGLFLCFTCFFYWIITCSGLFCCYS